MRIRCDQCGAKYQVSDDKVRHKVFKIRCKRCENVIIVRANEESPQGAAQDQSVDEGTQTGDNEATRQIQRNENQSIDASAVWHIVVNREQVGPITPQDVAGYLGRGEVTGDAFVWKEGLGDWQKLSAIAEFTHLFDETQGAPPPQDDPRHEAQSGDALAFPGGQSTPDEDVMMSSAAEEPEQDPFAQVEASDDEGVSEGPHADKLRGQRNDNSVLFSLDALDAADEAPAVTNTGGTDGSGLIDISLLENFGGGDSASALSTDDGVGGLGVIGTPAQLPSIVNRRRGNGGLIVAIIFGALIVGGGVFGAIYLSKQDDKKTSRDEEVGKRKTPPGSGSPGGQPPKEGGPEQTGNIGGVAGNSAGVTGNSVGANSNGASTNEVTAPTGVQGPNAGSETAAAPGAPGGQTGVATPPIGSQANSAQPGVPMAANTAQKPGIPPAQGPTTAGSQAAKKPVRTAPRGGRNSTKSKARSNYGRRSNTNRNRARTRPKKKTNTAVATTSAPAPKPVAKPKPKPKPKASGGDEVDDLLSGLNGGGGGGSSAKPKPARNRPVDNTPAADPLLPEKLGKRDIMSVIKRNSRKVLSCKSDDPNLGGVVKVRIVISPSGRVSSANVITAHAGTSVGRCVSSKVRSFRFPKFRGPATMSIKVPFRL